MAKYCEVAVAVPLRRTFTYAIPAAMNGRVEVGSRVIVPFRRRAMVGVVVETRDGAPPGWGHTPGEKSSTPFGDQIAKAKHQRRGHGDTERTEKTIREIAEALDGVPALPPALVELGKWVANYYLAPVG
ncbi:MAG: hypothetical protein ACRD5G_10945 [Candidatus Acidiferrales bacterium]